MKRRDFLTGSTMVNTVVSGAAMVPVTTSFSQYQGTWSNVQSRHLLSRALFGVKKSDIDKATKLGLTGTLDLLFRNVAAPSPPVTTNPQDGAVVSGKIKLGETFVDQPVDMMEFERVKDYRSWWMSLIIEQDFSIIEKMVVFWHNHFVTETQVVMDSRYLYRYNVLLRSEAIGNFKNLATKMTIDSAMLVYLNGDQNKAKAPNENYARELLELFTVGKGPLIAPGNYTNYTEDDIKAAAKVLTGWQTNRNTFVSSLNQNQHDKSTKIFSKAFENMQIANNNDKEYIDLINMIFAQVETSNFICRKLYRWFVNYDITDDIETNIIAPMAKLLRDNNYDVKPVIRALISSEHFFDNNFIGCIIKNPVDLVTGWVKNFEVFLDKSDKYKYLFSMNQYLNNLCYVYEMVIGDPPNVAGWQAYYSQPAFYQLWINSVTLSYRNQYAFYYVSGFLKANGQSIAIIPDYNKLITSLSNPKDPLQLVKDLSDIIFPIKLTDNQFLNLKDKLVDKSKQEQDYYWTDAWNKYVQNPNDAQNTNIVFTKLVALLKAMTEMAEFQLM